MSRYFVYALIDPRNHEPFYIGKGSGTRPSDHMNESKQSTLNPRKYSKIQKIRSSGLEPLVEIISSNLSEGDAYDQEELLIKKYGRAGIDPNGILTNLVLGARPPNRNGKPHSEETKAKMRMAALGKKKSPEHCQSIGDSKRGSKHPNWGKSLPADRIEKIRQGNLGKKRTEQTRMKVALAHSYEYQIKSPQGKTRQLNSVQLKEFCQAMGLNKTSFVNACKAGKPYKGWMIKRL